MEKGSGMGNPPQDPHHDEMTAAEEDWMHSTEFQWQGHDHSAHVYEAAKGVWFIQVEDLDAYEVVVATSPKFRMPEPILESVRVAPNGVLMASVVNAKHDRLIAKELITIERGKFPTPPVEEEPVEG